MDEKLLENRRILVVDDDQSIHDDFKAVLGNPRGRTLAVRLSKAEKELFDGPTDNPEDLRFDVDSALKGEEAAGMVEAAAAEDKPYALAFVDMRMPGQNGIDTIGQMWMADPRLQVVICTAYSDDSWERILRQLGRTDRLLILKKPFDGDEARQLALTLTTKWNLSRGMEAMVHDLEKRVSERTAAAEMARAEAEEASKIKSEFLSRMGQELRTPLNGVAGMIELLTETPLGPSQREYLQVAKTASYGLLAIINDMLDFSKMTTGKIELSSMPFDILAQIKDVTKRYATDAALKEIDLGCVLEPNIDGRVVGDPDRFTQVLENLLNNAIKYTDSGRIVVRLSCPSSNDESIEALVKITDTGVGIPPDKLDILVKSFSQADESSTRHHEGFMIGLTICKRVIRMMGGQIGVESTVGKGTTFWFTVPLKRDLSTPTQTPSTETRLSDSLVKGDDSLAGTRILVVEDSDVIQFFVTNLLARHHLDFDVAANGRLALEAISQEKYGLILMECDLPEMDGFETSRKIREMELAAGDGRKVPILALTAGGVNGDRKKCMDAGMDDYVAKPIERSELFAKMRRLVRRSSAAFDVNTLLERCMGDAELAREALEVFRKQSMTDLEMLEHSVTEARRHDTTQLAHGLKGAALHLGAERLGVIAAKIERLGDSASQQTLIQSLDELKTELERCIAFMPKAQDELSACANANSKNESH